MRTISTSTPPWVPQSCCIHCRITQGWEGRVHTRCCWRGGWEQAGGGGLHSPCGLHQRHGPQPQQHRAPRATHFLDGGDLQQVEALNEVKAWGMEGVRASLRAHSPSLRSHPITISLPVTFSYLFPTRSSSQSRGHGVPAKAKQSVTTASPQRLQAGAHTAPHPWELRHSAHQEQSHVL